MEPVLIGTAGRKRLRKGACRVGTPLLGGRFLTGRRPARPGYLPLEKQGMCAVVAELVDAQR